MKGTEGNDGDAVDGFVRAWDAIPPAERQAFSTVTALCARPDGTVIGPRFPDAVVDAAQSLIIRQAGNRLHIQRALFAEVLS